MIKGGNRLPTCKYPEYWLTPGVVSQMPEFVTKSIAEFEASCRKIVRLTPSSWMKARFPLSDGVSGSTSTYEGVAEMS